MTLFSNRSFKQVAENVSLLQCVGVIFLIFHCCLFCLAHEMPNREPPWPKNEFVLKGCDVTCQPMFNYGIESNFTILVTLNDTKVKEVICGHKKSYEVLEMFRSHLGNELEATRFKIISLCNSTLHYLENIFSNTGNSITELDIENIHFTRSSVFFPSLPRLQQLKKLHLVNSNLVSLSEIIFKKLGHLEELLAAGNVLGRSSFNGFHDSLRALKFHNNTLEISQHDLRNLAQLQELHLDKYSADVLVNDDTFANMKNLKILNLTRQENIPRKIRLEADIFKENRQLRKLILRKNSIEACHRDSFANLHQLKTLDLSYNSFSESLMDDCFRNLANLESLILTSNNLQYLPLDMFRGLDNLQTLVLSANSFTIASDKAAPFYYMPKVKSINLSNSRIRQLSASWFTNLTQLEFINLEYNSIREISYTDLLRLSRHKHQKMLTIYLKGNDWVERWNSVHLSREDNSSPTGSPVKLHPNFFGTCDNEREMTAFFNPLRKEIELISNESTGRNSSNGLDTNDSAPKTCSCFCEECFLPCSCQFNPTISTITLNCSGRFKEPTFDLLSLKKAISFLEIYVNYTLDLDLSFNKFGNYVIDLDWLQDIPVHALNLSFNSLPNFPLPTNWPVKSLLPKLEVLDLRSNNLKEIPSQLLLNKYVEDNFVVYLDGNRFRCDCNNGNSWLNQNSNLSGNLIGDFEKLNCYQDETSSVAFSLRGYKTEYCKQGYRSVKWMSAAISLLVLSISASLFAALYAKRSYSAARNEENIRRECSISSGHGTNSSLTSPLFLYDAFISYSHKDEEFIIKEIVPGLESPNDGSPKYQLCLHERDWLAGEWIADQIMQSVAASRRTIVVLSDNFIHSFWGKMEFRAAYQQVIQSKERRLIVIVKDEVPDLRPLDEDLKLFVANNTYLRWGDPFFWKKLRKALGPS